MDYLLNSSIFIALFLLVISVGRAVLSLFRFDFHSEVEGLVFAFSIGFGVIGYLVLFLGMAGLLYPWILFLTLLLIALLVSTSFIKNMQDIFKILSHFKDCHWMCKVLFILLGVGILVTFCAGLAPSYSNDSMVYHLKDARYFAEHHSIGHIPYDSTNALWPYLVEMYFVIALIFGRYELAGVFHVSFALAGAAAIYAFSKRFFPSPHYIVSHNSRNLRHP